MARRIREKLKTRGVRIVAWTSGVLATALAALLTGLLTEGWNAVFHRETQKTTEVRYFAVQAADSGHVLLRVAGEDSGPCLNDHSLADSAGDPTVTRCFGRVIRDPCFETVFGRVAYCVQSPWARSAVQFRITGIVRSGSHVDTVRNRRSGAPPGPPWALVLTNGERCTFNTGAALSIGGLRINYQCPGGVALGEPYRGAEPWAIAYQASGSDASTTVTIAVAWY